MIPRYVKPVSPVRTLAKAAQTVAQIWRANKIQVRIRILISRNWCPLVRKVLLQRAFLKTTNEKCLLLPEDSSYFSTKH
jgi:hypothetical protein